MDVMMGRYLTHFDKLLVVACSYNQVTISGPEGLEQKQQIGPEAEGSDFFV